MPGTLRPGTSSEAVTVGDRYTPATILNRPARPCEAPVGTNTNNET